MLRHLVRNFHRALGIQSPQVAPLVQVVLAPAYFIRLQKHRAFLHVQQTCNLCAAQQGALDTDSEYIVPYKSEAEATMRASVLVEALRTRFRISDSDAKTLLRDDVVYRAFRERSLLVSLELLCLEGVTKRSFIDYPWLITLERGRLTKKIALLRSLEMRDINHFVPFLRLSVPRLRTLVAGLIREKSIVPQGNRIYYVSEKLKTDVRIVSKYLSKRLFVLEMPFDMLKNNLQHMLDYNVNPLNILRDLWAFKYTPKSVQLRFERAKRAKKGKIMPWMVRCPEPILQRSLKLTLDELEVLGGKSTAAEYVSERLGFDLEETKAIMARHPAVNRVRVTKIKEVLDYLLKEAEFTRHEIAQVPRILCHSLDTTKKRLDELKSHGCRPSSLVIVCRSKREYQKFVQSWTQMKNKGCAITCGDTEPATIKQ